jgi:hypothetical protein
MKRNLKNILDNLTPILKEAYYADNTLNSIKDAARLGQINTATNQLIILEKEVMNILLGRSSLNNFKETLKSRLNIPEANLAIINKVIQDKIFESLENDLNQLKINQPELTSQNIPPKETIIPKTTLEIPKLELNPKKIKVIKESTQKQSTLEIIKKEVSEKKQAIKENVLEPIIPKYSFPEPSNVLVKKPVSKMEELKRVVAPKVSSEQQEKIREKLLAAMKKKDVQPEIVEKMKKVSLKKPTPKEKKEPLKKKSIGEVASSKVLGGEGKKFQDEEVFKKTEKEKPYILDVKLKEDKEKKEKIPTTQEPIPYKKYQKKNPFGKA